MSLTQLAVILAGIYLILIGLSVALSSTATLIFGIAIVVLVVLDAPFARTAYRGRAVP